MKKEQRQLGIRAASTGAETRIATRGRGTARVLALALSSALVAAGAWAQVWEVRDQGLVRVGTAQAFDQFGQQLISGDFNDDNFRDLMVGAPFDDGSASGGGLVQIYMGSANGLGAATAWWTGTQPGMNLGASLAAGDFDGDGRDEIAVGAPGWDAGGVDQAGRLYVWDLQGTSWVLSSLQQNDFALTNEVGDRFGERVVAGNFNNDAFVDVVVGMPDEGFALASSGAILQILGSATGLATAGSVYLRQDQITGAEQANAQLGYSLAAGDFNGDDAFWDLAIGAPYHDVSGVANAGLVAVLYGGAGGVSTTGLQVFNDSGLGGALAVDDYFGWAVATGDFNRTSGCWSGFACRTDLVIGVPGKQIGGAVDAGRVWVLYGGGGVAMLDQGDLTGSSPESGDFFGQVLLSEWFESAFLNGRDGTFFGADDLVIGVPGENWNGVAFQGVVHLVFGSPAGLNAGDISQWRIAATGLASAPPASGDNFGYSLALGRFDGRYTDLAIGIPGRDNGATQNTGMTQIMYGALFADGFESGGSVNW